MGKKLVIKGADFSENGIVLEPMLDDYVDCVVGQGWGTSNGFTKTSNAARVSNNITLTSVFPNNVTGIKLTPRSGYKLASIIYDNIVEGAMDNTFLKIWFNSYNTNPRTLNFSDGNSFVLMIAPTDTSVTELTSDKWETYLDVEFLT